MSHPSDSERFVLVFRGECIRGYDPTMARSAVVSVLRLDAEREARLFSGQRVVMRRNLDAATARDFVERFAGLGVRLWIEPVRGRPSTRRLALQQESSAPAKAAMHRWRRRATQVAAVMLSIPVTAGIGALIGPTVSGWIDSGTPRGDSAMPVLVDLAPKTLAMPAANPNSALANTEPSPEQPMPSAARREYELHYRGAQPNKAFAVSRAGGYGWHGNAASENEARARALERCMQRTTRSNDPCRIVDANGEVEE